MARCVVLRVVKGQISFNGMEPKKQIRSSRFLDEMNRVVPWKRLCRVIEPHYHSSPIGRTKTPLLLLLKIYCLQQWYTLSDPGVEEAVYDRYSFQRFLGLGEHGDCARYSKTLIQVDSSGLSMNLSQIRLDFKLDRGQMDRFIKEWT